MLHPIEIHNFSQKILRTADYSSGYRLTSTLEVLYLQFLPKKLRTTENQSRSSTL